MKCQNTQHWHRLWNVDQLFRLHLLRCSVPIKSVLTRASLGSGTIHTMFVFSHFSNQQLYAQWNKTLWVSTMPHFTKQVSTQSFTFFSAIFIADFWLHKEYLFTYLFVFKNAHHLKLYSLFSFNFLLLSFTDLNLAAAILALLSLTMMMMGSICIGMSLSKGVPFFLKPAAFSFILSGGTSWYCTLPVYIWVRLFIRHTVALCTYCFHYLL